MASLRELVILNNEGDLGSMLAKKFHGKRGHMSLRKDSELLIGFKSREETPPVGDIATAVTEHYESIGYKVEPDKRQDPDSFEAVIFSDTRDQGLMHVLITTFYPLEMGDEHNHLRVTTTFID